MKLDAFSAVVAIIAAMLFLMLVAWLDQAASQAPLRHLVHL